MATAVKPVFPWQARYSVGMEDIDAQHKRLIGLINDLQAAMLRGEGKMVIGGIVEELVRYTKTHFAFEENMLRMRGYSDLAAHKLQHEKLVAQAHELSNDVKNGKLTVTMEVMHFLKNWLSGHIIGSDLRYAAELKK